MKTLFLLPFCLLALTASGEVPGIHLADKTLKVELLDTHPEEFFLSHDMDLKGRLYLGSREAVFVYERTDDGGFQKRKELYRFPKDTWVYDLEAFGDDLLVLTNTALYRLRNVLGAEPKLEKILWGNPLGHHHQGLHGIEFAPDGDLIIVMGDPHPGVHMDKTRPDHLWMWTWYVGPKNRPVPYAGVGAAMRLDLDTYDFSVYASGLRNPCGISFDRDWNLFANDNDQESTTATPGRLMHVPEHSWNGWARGWDSTQNPARLDMIPNVNWAIDVPVGQGYYDHTTLGEEYRGSLFVANWGSRSVSHHPIKPEGAGFRADSLPFLLADGNRRPLSALPTNDGRLIVALCYMKGNAPSPVCQTDLLLISPRKSEDKFRIRSLRETAAGAAFRADPTSRQSAPRNPPSRWPRTQGSGRSLCRDGSGFTRFLQSNLSRGRPWRCRVDQTDHLARPGQRTSRLPRMARRGRSPEKILRPHREGHHHRCSQKR